VSVYCSRNHNTEPHASLCSSFGFPSRLSDDWVTRDAAHVHSVHASKIAAAYPELSHHLRIARFSLRISSALGNAPVSEHGQPAHSAPLLTLLGAELSDLELALTSLSPLVSIRLLDAKLQLYTFELQNSNLADPEALLACYTAAVRIISLVSDMSAVPGTRPVFLPRSVMMSFLSATVRSIS
jgi:hypothetical protein